MSRIASWATAALVVLNTDIASHVSAKAQSAALALDGTLRKIKETGAVTLAYREFSVPFSYYDDKQQPVGYAMDLCYRIADAVKKELRLDKLEVKLNPVTSATRIPLIANGTVDLECGSTTNTLERQKQVAFTITHFVTANRFMSKRASNLKTVDDLKGKTVVSTSGSTNIKQIIEINAQRNLGMNILNAKDHPEAFLMVETDRAAAFVMDDILLYSMVASAKTPAAYQISADPLSVEPYAIMLRRDDAAFKKVVDAAMIAIYKSGEINAVYDKWFMKPIPPKNINLNVPAPPIRSLRLHRRCHPDTAQAAGLDGALDQARRLGLLDELADIGQPSSLALRNPDPDQIDPIGVGQDLGAGQLHGIVDQRLTRRRECLHLAGTQQIESGVRDLRSYQLGVLHDPAQREGRGVIAHDRDTSPGPVHGGDAVERRAGRYQVGIVELDDRLRKVHLRGPGWLDTHDHHVAVGGLDALHGLGRRWTSDQPRLDSEASGKSARNLHGHDPGCKRPQLAGCRVLGVLRRKQRDPDLAGLHEVRDPRVADRRRCGERERRQDRRGGRRCLAPTHRVLPF
jgi:glutamate/aspartate transport system substrate-binding protein